MNLQIQGLIEKLERWCEIESKGYSGVLKVSRVWAESYIDPPRKCTSVNCDCSDVLGRRPSHEIISLTIGLNNESTGIISVLRRYFAHEITSIDKLYIRVEWHENGNWEEHHMRFILE